jgi:hypothetical protein
MEPFFTKINSRSLAKEAASYGKPNQQGTSIRCRLMNSPGRDPTRRSLTSRSSKSSSGSLHRRLCSRLIRRPTVLMR